MKLYIVAIADKQLGTYQAPGFITAPGAAVRSFQDMINDHNNPMYKHPEDYTLHILGTWDDATGRFDNALEIKTLAVGAELKTS